MTRDQALILLALSALKHDPVIPKVYKTELSSKDRRRIADFAADFLEGIITSRTSDGMATADVVLLAFPETLTKEST